MHYTGLLILLITLTPSLLKGQSQEQIEQFQEDKKAYFTENLELSEEESLKFWPIYEDYQNRKTELLESERAKLNYIRNNFENLSEKEALDMLKELQKYREGQLELDKEFYQGKSLKALSAKKVLKLQKVEMEYRRHLIGRLRHGPRDGSGRGNGRGYREGGGGGKGPIPEQELTPLPSTGTGPEL